MSCTFINMYDNDFKQRSGSDIVNSAVDSYLRKRRFVETEHYRKSELILNQSVMDMTISTTVVKDVSSLNSISYRPDESNNDFPTVVEHQFTNLKTWINESKEEKCRQELYKMLFPFLCHLYLELLGASIDKQKATKFLMHHQELFLGHEEYREIAEELSQVSNIQDIEAKPRVIALRSSKHEFKISSSTMAGLEKFLMSQNPLILLQVLQTWFDIEVVPSDEAFNLEQELADNATLETADYLEGMNHQVSGDKDMRNLQEITKLLRATPTPSPTLLLYTLNNSEGVCCAKASHSGKLLATGYTSSQLKLWSLSESMLSTEKKYCATVNLATNTPTPSHKLKEARHTRFLGHCGPVTGIEFLRETDILLSTSHDTTMRAWRVTDQSPAAIYRGHNHPVWCVAASSLGAHMATGSHDRTARLWSLDRTYPLRLYAGHTDDVNCVQFHPNGNYLATGSADHSVRLWSVNDGNLVRVYSANSSSVLAVSFSPNGQYLASAGEDCKVRVWDLASGRMLAELKGHTLQVTGLDWSMDSSFLASASLDGTVRVWNSTLHIKSSTSENEDHPAKFTTHCSSILSLQCLLRGNLLAVGAT